MCHKFITTLLLGISTAAAAQDNTLTRTISDAPLTPEHIGVYRAVLTDYLKGSDRILNVADMTEPSDQSDTACLKGLRAGAAKGSRSVVHRIGPSLVAGMRIVLVDPDRQQDSIKKNDPGDLIRKAVDDGQKISDEQLDQSVEKAFETGLFTLSEVAFDKEHHDAVVSYSFECGGLCGNGNTVILKKIGDGWKVVRRCGGWVS